VLKMRQQYVYKNQIKENCTMEDVDKAKNIKIIYLPPATVASAHYMEGLEPESATNIIMKKFINDTELFKINPSVRLYGFNKPIQLNGEQRHCYELWATIPDDMEVPAPLVKRKFAGGLYACYTSKPVNWDDWGILNEWVGESEDFEHDRREPHEWEGRLEEHFNAFNIYGLESKFKHFDFLIPIKRK